MNGRQATRAGIVVPREPRAVPRAAPRVLSRILSRVAALGLALSATVPAPAQDLTRELTALPTAALLARAESLPPYGLYLLAGHLFADGRRDEAARWLYVAQIRARLDVATSPGERPDAGPALYGALDEEVGRPINAWAFGDVDALAARMQEALDWDAAHPAADPDFGMSAEDRAAALARVRAGLARLRTNVLAERDEIRRKRSAAGLENR